MGQPDARGTLVAGPLADVSIAYKNRNYIADRVFPLIDNVPLDAKIARYLKGAWFRDEAGIRGPGSRAKRGGYPTDFISLAVQEYAFAKEVTDEDKEIALMQGAAPLKPDQDALEFCSDKIDLKKERLVANMILTGTWSGIAAGEDAGGLWAAGGGNTFLADVRARKEYIRSQTGMVPNVMWIDYGTYNSLKEESTVLDKIKYTEKAILTKDLLAAIIELDEVIIGEAVLSTAVEKKDGTDFTASNIWEKNAGKGSAFLYFRPRAAGLKTPSAGYQCRTKINGAPRRVMTWREEAEHQDVYEVAERTQLLQVGADLGFLWVDTLLT